MRMRTSLRERRRQVIYVVPNLLTTGNLFCGLYAIMAVFGANYMKAAIAILVALVFDMLDGQSARWTKTSATRMRSEEHTSELQSPCNLVCRLLLEKKKKKKRK